MLFQLREAASQLSGLGKNALKISIFLKKVSSKC